MKKQQTRWYLLFFCAVVLFAATAAINLMGQRQSGYLTVLQLLAAVLCLAAGIVNRRRWQKTREDEAN